MNLFIPQSLRQASGGSSVARSSPVEGHPPVSWSPRNSEGPSNSQEPGRRKRLHCCGMGEDSTAARFRVLVVEDDPAIRRLFEKLLVRRSVEIDTASNGRTAVEKLRSGRYSALILDLMVPELDGFEVIDFLKSEKLHLPVAVVSAVSQQALNRLDRDIVKMVIAKPFDVDEFTKSILALCEEHESQRASEG
jgi:CheY-like chemotaxis protein